MGAHLIDGEFQSDKYPTCPRGKVPLSVKDPTAQDLLWEYAQRRRTVDTEFSDDLEAALRAKGFEGARDPSVSDLQSVLSAAVSALGDVMLEMQRRKLMAEGRFKINTPMYEKAVSSALTDEQVGDLAARAFEAGAMTLARVGHPDAAVFNCSPSEEP